MRFSPMLDVWLSNLSKTGRSRKQAVAIAIDALLVVFSLWAAYSLRYGAVFSDFRATWHLFVLLPVCSILIFSSFGIYRWVVRSSNDDLFRQLIKASIISSLILVLITYLLPPDRTNPRSLFIIFGMLLIISACGVRYLWRMLFDSGNEGEPIAIYGAGEAGRQLLHALSQGNEYRPVLLLDDNPAIAGTMVSGVPVVLGNSNDTAAHLIKSEVERVVMAMPSISSSDYKVRIEAIRSAGIAVQTIPSYAELVAGTAKYSEVRDISITDILGRSEVPPNPELLGKCVRGKSVLVTGGGGSIGSELCRQILLQDPATLIVVDQSEENLYKITEEIDTIIEAKLNVDISFNPILGSVNDEAAMAEIMTTYNIDTVYHAAAYKHVPIVESYPEQGVSVNVFGTLAVLDAAIDANVENFTLISTDKAVRPTNAMGATKRIAELVLQAKAGMPSVTTRISMVRFGNVLGSSGSVVPKFKKQIEAGGPITITDPDMTRYFMTIPEAAQLVLQASAIAKGGDVFVLDMGEPVRIEDLAVSMVRMMGKKLKRESGIDSDIEIEFRGTRPGEKMYEEMFITNNRTCTVVPKVFTADEYCLEWEELKVAIDRLSTLSNCSDRKELRNLLLELSFTSPDKIRHPEIDEQKIRKRAENLSEEKSGVSVI